MKLARQHEKLARQHVPPRETRAPARSATRKNIPGREKSRASTFRDEKLARQRFPRVPQIGARKSVQKLVWGNQRDNSARQFSVETGARKSAERCISLDNSGRAALNDPHRRFQQFGAPPVRHGDFAYLLHIVRSVKSTGRGACILPQGILFRGSSEAEIRLNLVRKGYIKGIIGLPANLFYGTGIPGCIVVIDKFDAHNRKGVFIVDASGDFLKAGRKNCLREMDLRRIADVFKRQVIIPGYSRMVAVSEIGKNEFNLNISRYINREAA